MSWLYLPEQEAGSSPQSGSLAGRPSATSKKKNIRSGSSRHGSGTDSLMTPRSGPMSGRSPSETIRHGRSSANCGRYAALWLSRRVSPVNRSAWRENPEPRQTSGTVGRIPFALLEKSGRRGFFWRMYQDSLPGLTDTMARFSKSWPRAGMMLDGVCYLRPRWERRISETGSGLWPTPRNNTGPSMDRKHLSLDGAVRLWPTPVYSDHSDRAPGRPHLTKNGTIRHVNKAGQQSFMRLSQVVKLWPTPTVNGNHNRAGLSKKSGDGLATAVKRWATPSARDWRSGKASEETHQRNARPLSEQVIRAEKFRAPTQTDATKWNNASVQERRAKGRSVRLPNQVAPGRGGQLNPMWVEWLMGWPLGWTDSRPLGTGRFLTWLRSRGLN